MTHRTTLASRVADQLLLIGLAPIGGFLCGVLIVVGLKYHDVAIVRRVVPNLGLGESLFWPVDEPRDMILYCPSPRDPDYDTREAVQKWVEARRAEK